MVSAFSRIFFNSIKDNPLTSFTITDVSLVRPFFDLVVNTVGEGVTILLIDEENADEMENVMRSHHLNRQHNYAPTLFIGPRLRNYQTFYGTEVYQVDLFDAGEAGRGRSLIEITPVKVDRRFSQIRSLESLVLDLTTN